MDSNEVAIGKCEVLPPHSFVGRSVVKLAICLTDKACRLHAARYRTSRWKGPA
jgi:hypothetical protein